MTTYKQEAQSQLDMAKAMMKNFSTGAANGSTVISVAPAAPVATPSNPAPASP